MRAEKLDTEIRKEQILQAVFSIVASRGLKGLSIQGVARRVGLVPSAIYRHFKSKDAALDAALDAIRERLLGNTQAVCGQFPDALARLHGLLMRHVQLIEENQAIPRIVFSEEIFHGSPARRAKVWGIIRTYLDGVAEIVRRGQKEGQIRSGLDPKTASVLFLGLIQPAGILWILSEEKFDVRRHAERAWDVFADAIRGDGPRAGARSGRSSGPGVGRRGAPRSAGG